MTVTDRGGLGGGWAEEEGNTPSLRPWTETPGARTPLGLEAAAACAPGALAAPRLQEASTFPSRGGPRTPRKGVCEPFLHPEPLCSPLALPDLASSVGLGQHPAPPRPPIPSYLHPQSLPFILPSL